MVARGGALGRVRVVRHHDDGLLELAVEAAEEVLELLSRLNREFKKTIVMVTHDPHAAERATTRYHLDKGVLSN